MSDLFSPKHPAAGIPAATAVVCRLALELPNGMWRALLEHDDGRISIATIRPEQAETIETDQIEFTFEPGQALAVAQAILSNPRRADVHISPKMKALAALCLVIAEKRAAEKED